MHQHVLAWVSYGRTWTLSRTQQLKPKACGAIVPKGNTGPSWCTHWPLARRSPYSHILYSHIPRLALLEQCQDIACLKNRALRPPQARHMTTVLLVIPLSKTWVPANRQASRQLPLKGTCTCLPQARHMGMANRASPARSRRKSLLLTQSTAATAAPTGHKSVAGHTDNICTNPPFSVGPDPCVCQTPLGSSQQRPQRTEHALGFSSRHAVTLARLLGPSAARWLRPGARGVPGRIVLRVQALRVAHERGQAARAAALAPAAAVPRALGAALLPHAAPLLPLHASRSHSPKNPTGWIRPKLADEGIRHGRWKPSHMPQHHIRDNRCGSLASRQAQPHARTAPAVLTRSQLPDAP